MVGLATFCFLVGQLLREHDLLAIRARLYSLDGWYRMAIDDDGPLWNHFPFPSP